MGLGASVLQTLCNMLFMVACIVGGTFLGMFLRKRKNQKLSKENK